MNSRVPQSDRGILNAEAARQRFSLMRFYPADDLSQLVESYWVVRWDLRGQPPFQQVILSYPNVNLSFEREHAGDFAGVTGIPKKTYTRHLQDEGVVLGVKFRPAGFYPFWKQPASLLTGKMLDIREAFGAHTALVTARILDQEDGAAMAREAELFLRDQLPEPDDNVELVNRIVQAAIDNRDMTKVEDMVQQFGINIRTLQRLFSRYVGVSPKWVIQRYRLQEAAELMEKGGIPDWPKLAQELGYYDQAHFIKDFKAIIGKAPEAYIKTISG